MKNLLYILLFFLVSCSTPESKILDSFNEGRPYRRVKHEIEVKSVSIYDTIYAKENYKYWEEVQAKLLNIQKGFRENKNTPNYYRHGRQEDDYGSLLRRQGNMYLLYRDVVNDSICGYYARIITSRDTFNFVVTTKYNILCPVFVYTGEY
jgi:hypothetical protein